MIARREERGDEALRILRILSLALHDSHVLTSTPEANTTTIMIF